MGFNDFCSIRFQRTAKIISPKFWKHCYNSKGSFQNFPYTETLPEIFLIFMKHLKLATIVFLFSFVLTGCNFSFLTEGGKIISGDKLSHDDINYIKDLGLLDDNENIILFSSQHDHRTSGNFFTEKRVAGYWKYDKKPEDDKMKSAFFNDIKAITVNYDRGATYATEIVVQVGNENDNFSIYIDDDRKKEEDFYEQLLAEWEKIKNTSDNNEYLVPEN